MAYRVENRVGRLIEVKMCSGMSLQELQQFRTDVWLALGRISGRAVFVSDSREADMFGPEVAEQLLRMFVVDNPKVERAAYILARSGGAFAAQMEHLIAEAEKIAAKAGKKAPQRRAFSDKHEAQRWLGEVLETDERDRLQEMIEAM